MSREIELRLRAALVAKANTVTEADLQPALVPEAGAIPSISRRIRRLLILSAPVLAAAAVSGLAVAGVLTPTHHGASSSVPSMTTPPTLPGPTGPGLSHPTATPPTKPAVNPTTPNSSAAAAPALPAGGPVPAGFQPASVTFVSPTFGYVLGTPPSCASPPCTSMVRTMDRGAHWVGVPAPRASLGELSSLTLAGGRTSVSEVRFADPYNGWAYGPALWVTHDGARTWHPLDVGGQVLALEAGGGRVDAVVTNCAGSASCPARPARLLSSPVSSDAFTQVAAEQTDLSVPGAWYGGTSITLHAPAGFALLGATGQTQTPAADIVATGGNAWVSFSDPCRAVPHTSLSAFTAPDAASLVSLCSTYSSTGHRVTMVVVTRNGKGTVMGRTPASGDTALITANGISTILIGSMGIDDHLYRSTDSGRTWTALALESGNEGLTDLGFTTPQQAVVIHGQPPLAHGQNRPAELLMTTDAGATWHQITF